MATRFEIISQTVVRSIASDKNFEVLRIGLPTTNLARRPLIKDHSCACLLIQICCSTTQWMKCVGCSGHVERRVWCCASRHRACRRWSCHRPKARLISNFRYQLHQRCRSRRFRQSTPPVNHQRQPSRHLRIQLRFLAKQGTGH